MTERPYSVLLGTARASVSEGEYAAATASRGQTVWFRHRLGKFPFSRGLSGWKRGTFIDSMFYDGVIASVYEDDPDDYIEYRILCDPSLNEYEEVFRLSPPENNKENNEPV